RPIATTNDAGKFEAVVARADLERDMVLVATAAGLGPDWIVASALKKGEQTLRLVKDGPGIRGRLLDLEGRPLANITVDVHWVGKKPGEPGRVSAGRSEDIGQWIDTFIALHKGAWNSAGNPLYARPAALGVTPSVTTDKAGYFTLKGLGRGHVAMVF